MNETIDNDHLILIELKINTEPVLYKCSADEASRLKDEFESNYKVTLPRLAVEGAVQGYEELKEYQPLSIAIYKQDDLIIAHPKFTMVLENDSNTFVTLEVQTVFGIKDVELKFVTKEGIEHSLRDLMAMNKEVNKYKIVKHNNIEVSQYE